MYLEHGGGGGDAVGELVELLGAVVVDEDVHLEDVADGLQRAAGGERAHIAVGYHQHRDGAPLVDVRRQPRLRQQLVELRVLRVLAQDLGDVVPLRRRRRGEQHRRDQAQPPPRVHWVSASRCRWRVGV